MGGMQKIIEIEDEKRLQNLYEKRMAQEIDGNVLGDEFDGYIFRISGGNDIAVPNEVAGLTDDTVPRRLGPKRANKIRKLFNLSKYARHLRSSASSLPSCCNASVL